MENFTYSSDAWFAPKDANFRDDRPIILTNQRPTDFSQGISYITKADYSKNSELEAVMKMVLNKKALDMKLKGMQSKLEEMVK